MQFDASAIKGKNHNSSYPFLTIIKQVFALSLYANTNFHHSGEILIIYYRSMRSNTSPTPCLLLALHIRAGTFFLPYQGKNKKKSEQFSEHTFLIFFQNMLQAEQLTFLIGFFFNVFFLAKSQIFVKIKNM